MIDELMKKIRSASSDTSEIWDDAVLIDINELKELIQKFMPDEDNYEYIINVREYATSVADEWIKEMEELYSFEKLYEKIVFSVDPPKSHWELKEKWSLEYWSKVDTVEEAILMYEKDIEL